MIAATAHARRGVRGDTTAVDAPTTAPDRPCPRDFRYWDHLAHPRVQALRAAVRAVLRFDPAPADEVVRALAAMYYDADPVAEAFVAEAYRGPGGTGRALLERALAGGIDAVPDAPPSLRALLADVDTDPPWLDWAEVERGARVFRRFGVDVFRFAGAITLEGYAEASVAKPLALTGAYAGATTRRRFLETVAFWIAVSEPSGLRPGAAGHASALRVRVMHVFVRSRLASHREWDHAAWGVPISQGDALLTLMGGSFAPGLALHAMGYLPSRADILALMAFWRYVGHLMGVRPGWYPTTLTEAAQLTFVTLVKGARRAGDDGRALCQAYAKAFEPAPPAPDAPLRARLRDALEHRLHLGYTRFFTSRRTYAGNGLPPAGPWALAPLVQAPVIGAAELLRRLVPPLDAVADRVARHRRDRWFAWQMGGRAAEYQPAEQFTRQGSGETSTTGCG